MEPRLAKSSQLVVTRSEAAQWASRGRTADRQGSQTAWSPPVRTAALTAPMESLRSSVGQSLLGVAEYLTPALRTSQFLEKVGAQRVPERCATIRCLTSAFAVHIAGRSHARGVCCRRRPARTKVPYVAMVRHAGARPLEASMSGSHGLNFQVERRSLAHQIASAFG